MKKLVISGSAKFEKEIKILNINNGESLEKTIEELKKDE